MKTENNSPETVEIDDLTRARVFSAYAFGEAKIIPNSRAEKSKLVPFRGVGEYMGSYHYCNTVGQLQVSVKYCSIEVKPLGGISDEDAEKIGSMLNRHYSGEKAIRIGKKFIHQYVENRMEALFELYQVIEIIDYLRSRGYALPWGEYSVDQLVEAGIFKLTDK